MGGLNYFIFPTHSILTILSKCMLNVQVVTCLVADGVQINIIYFPIHEQLVNINANSMLWICEQRLQKFNIEQIISLFQSSPFGNISKRRWKLLDISVRCAQGVLSICFCRASTRMVCNVYVCVGVIGLQPGAGSAPGFKPILDAVKLGQISIRLKI